jgi:hypothetical protein
MFSIMMTPLSRASGGGNRTVVSRLYFNALLVSLTGSQIMSGTSPVGLPPHQPLTFLAIPARAFVFCQPTFDDHLKTGFHLSTFSCRLPIFGGWEFAPTWPN